MKRYGVVFVEFVEFGAEMILSAMDTPFPFGLKAYLLALLAKVYAVGVSGLAPQH